MINTKDAVFEGHSASSDGQKLQQGTSFSALLRLALLRKRGEPIETQMSQWTADDGELSQWADTVTLRSGKRSSGDGG